MSCFKAFKRCKIRRVNKHLEEYYNGLVGCYWPSKLPEEKLLLVNGYRKMNFLGKGSYGEVYRVQNKQGKDLALKVINRVSISQNAAEKFLPRELKILKMLNHKHILKLKDIIHTDEKTYVFMELAKNGSIKDCLRINGPLKESLVRKYFFQLVKALKFCQAKGIVHRDLKLENILLDEDDNIKLADFGCSKEIWNKENKIVIMSNTYCGTPSYMSPDVLQHKAYNPLKSDMWSLGVCLFEMLFNCKPFKYENRCQILGDQMNGRWQFPPQINASSYAKAMVENLLKPDVDQRINLIDIKQELWPLKACEDIKRHQVDKERATWKIFRKKAGEKDKITKLEELLANKEKEIADLNENLRLKDADLKSLQKLLQEKNEMINEQKKQIKDCEDKDILCKENKEEFKKRLDNICSRVNNLIDLEYKSDKALQVAFKKDHQEHQVEFQI